MKDLNKFMILGTGGRGEDGDVCITDFAKQRVNRAIEEAAIRKISLRSNVPFLLFSGGHSPELFDTPPPTSEAKRMADYALRMYRSDGLTASAILLEEESTNTYENFFYSVNGYTEFFEETLQEERELAIVSHSAHIGRAAASAAGVLNCSPAAIIAIPVRGKSAPVIDLSLYRSTEEQLEATGDE